MITLGCGKIDLLIEKFDGKVINGVEFHFISKSGIQAKFNHSGEEKEAIAVAKVFMHTDSDLCVLYCSAMQ